MSITHAEALTANDVPEYSRQLMARIDGIFWEAEIQTLQFTFVSAQAERLLGYPRMAWLTPNFWVDHLHPEDRARAIAVCAQAVSEERNHHFEYRMFAADGRVVWLRDSVSVIRAAGENGKLCGIMTDVTTEKRAEEERNAYLWFLESMDQVNRAIQGANDLEQMVNDLLDVVLATFDCDRAWLLCTRDPASPLWALPTERARPAYPCTFDRAFASHSYPEVMRLFQTVHAAGEPVCFAPGAAHELSAQLQAHLQVQSTLAMSLYPKDDDPYLFGLHQCSYARVWTAQEQRLLQEIGRRLGDALTTLLAYRRLHESEQRYRELFENTSDVMVISEVADDGRLRLLDFNPAWDAVMESDSLQLIGRYMQEFPDDPTVRTVLPYYTTAIQTKLPVQFEDQFVTATGQRYVHATLIPICTPDGDVYRVVGVGRNITEQKLAEMELRAGEARFRTFVDHATDAFFLHNAQGLIIDVNQRACESLGYTREELIGMSPMQFDRDLFTAEMRQLHEQLDANKTVTFERYHQRKDGSRFPVEISIRAFWLGDERFAISLARDIRERKRLQQELTLFRTLIDQATDIIEVIDPETARFVDVNEQACIVHGYTREEYLNLTVLQLNPTLAALPWERHMATLRQRGSSVYESLRHCKDGTIIPVEVNATYIRLDCDYVVAVVRDIRARKQAQAALAASEERYRVLYEDNPTMYFTLDTHGTVLSVNRFGAEHLGYTVDELVGTSLLQLLHEEDKATAPTYMQQCVEQPGKHFYWTLRKVCKDGNVMWVEESARAVYATPDTLVLLIVCNDITERKRTELALIESHNLLHAVVEGAHDCVFVKDREGRYLLMNQSGAELFGRPVEKIIGKDDFALFGPRIAERFRAADLQVMATGQSGMFEETEENVPTPRTFLTAKNAYRDADGTVVGLIGVSRDITELKRLEAQFRQAQKMDALGQLAGGVAHDFNNLLTVINGYSQLLSKHLADNQRSRHLLEEIIKAGNRAASLTRQLLAFSRKQVLQPQVVNLNQLLAELVAMLRRLIGEHIELRLHPDPALGWTKIDPGQFEQAIINLAVNARDAMPQGGELTIETYNVEIDDARAAQDPDLRAGRYVCVAVRDTGTGIAEATKAHLFEPFFTTKGSGKGTGLGLAMVYGFIKQSDGYIGVTSAIEAGATFTIYLPVVDPPLVAQQEKIAMHTAHNGIETILVVEDEMSVRTLVADILRGCGYHVLEAADPAKALALADSYPGAIQLLLTDVMMPQMDGQTLSQQIIAKRSEVKVLLMSGYTETVIAHQAPGKNDRAFLQKPFTVDTLLAKVGALLR